MLKGIIAVYTLGISLSSFALSIKNVATTLHTNGVLVSWDKIEDATKYKVEVWQESFKEPSGIIDFNETFEALDNQLGKKSKDFLSFETYKGDGWQGNHSYVPASMKGVLQVGGRDDPGYVLTPSISSVTNKNYTLEVIARSVDLHPVCDISLISGFSTNSIGTITNLTETSFTRYTFYINDIKPNDKLLFESKNSSREYRVRFDSIRLVSNYDEGAIITNFYKSIECEGLTNSCIAISSETSLQSGWYFVRVSAYSNDNELMADNGEYSVWRIPTVDGGIFDYDDEEDVEDEFETDETFTLRHYASTTNAFSFSWKRPFDFTNCILSVWTNYVEKGRLEDALWRESFSRLKEHTSLTPISNGDLMAFTDTGADSDWAYANLYFSPDKGSVRLGKSNEQGWLMTPAIEQANNASNRAIKISARKCNDNSGTTLPIDVVNSNNETNRITTLQITGEFQDFIVPIADNISFDRILIHSGLNKQNSISIISEIGVYEGFTEDAIVSVTNEVRELENPGLVIVSNLPPVKAYAQLKAIGESEVCYSSILEVDLSERGVIKASSFRNSEYNESFDFVKDIGSSAPWVNGETIQGFYAYLNGIAVTNIYFDSRKRNNAGLYASSTNTTEGAMSLSMRSTKDNEVALEFRVLNDFSTRIERFVLEYDLYEWPNSYAKSETVMQGEYAIAKDALLPPKKWSVIEEGQAEVTNRIGEISDAFDRYGFYRERKIITIPVRVEKNEVFCYRWISPRVVNAKTLGIGNVEIRCYRKPSPFFIIFR